MVTVESVGNSTAGENLYLECTVKTEQGVRPGDINIIWITPNGNVYEANRSTDGTTGRLNFSPLATSHIGHYTCVGRISNVGVNVSGNSSVDVNVNSES